MSFLTITNGRIQTDSSSQLGELDFGIGELAGRKKKKKGGFLKKHMKRVMKMHERHSPLWKLIQKKKKAKERAAKKKKAKKMARRGDEVTEQAAAEPGAPESVSPAALQPPTTQPFETYPGPMSPATYPMAPMYPSPMQPPVEYPSQPQFPQAYPSGGGYAPPPPQQPYYESSQQDSMPQFINTEEESEWQPPTPMYEGPSAYEPYPGERQVEYGSGQQSPFGTENEYASSDFTPQDAFGEGAMSGYLTSGEGDSWEDQSWGGMAGEYDNDIKALLAQAQMLRMQGLEGQALALEDQARALASMQTTANQTSGLWTLGIIALGAWLLFSNKGGGGGRASYAR